MIISEKQYKELSDRVYKLDPNDKKKYSPFMKERTDFNIENQKFQILKIQENSQTDGMQAMAVVSNINIR
ncbi:hypothetical protein [Enterococcus faecalis]|uniref:hypothetical protein n=1 Tax=Enterococcus TaxID=1350 RepID=UPI0034CF6A35